MNEVNHDDDIRLRAGSDPSAALREAIGGGRPYLIGVGGAGMSALARLLSSGGLRVRGSDPVPSPTTRALAEMGIAIDESQTAATLAEDADVVIASAAVRPDNEQALEAQRRGLNVLTYAEALGRCMLVRTGVCVAGTHGKSTTSAMLGTVLTDAGLDPSVIVGATCAQLAKGALADAPAPGVAGGRLGAERTPIGAYAGAPGVLVAEACEYNRSFHHHRPMVASIANVEADHLDIYGSLDEVVRAFRDFAQLIPPASDGGRLLIGHDGAHRREIAAGLHCRTETIGFSPSADWRVSYDPRARRASVEGPMGENVAWTVNMPGEHNAMNAAVAASLAIMLGADSAVVGRSLSAFRGLDRRLQLMGERVGVRVYDDYGHHPTEIDATLRALRAHERPEARDGRLIVVFQPHQHSRTRFLLDEFATSFAQADIVIVPHIYFVRDSEAEKQRVSSADLVDRLRGRGVRAMHLYPFEAIIEQLENLCRPGDLLVVMGAGPVWQIGRGYLDAGRPRGAPSVKRLPELERNRPIETWFGVGGAAESYCEPASIDALRALASAYPDLHVLGDGANLLIEDEGVDGLVVALTAPAFRGVEIDAESDVVRCGAGVKLPGLIGKACRAGLGGLEGLAGIPATIGGAVRMNAGGRFGEIGTVVKRVRGVNRVGEIVTLAQGDLDFGYRFSAVRSLILTEIELALSRGEAAELDATRQACAEAKKASQPLKERSGGCWFKNPTLADDIDGIGAAGDRVSAGMLIDRAGLKGLRVGSAEVSSVHANFVTVDRGGSASDVLDLMSTVTERVNDVFGVQLEREVVVWGRGGR